MPQPTASNFLQSNSGQRVLILDGGFGTTLKDILAQDVSGPLWSSRVIADNPQAIIDAHRAFLDAGAQVILTDTYQCAFSTYERAGYTRSDAVRLMRDAVRLAATAREEHLASHPDAPKPRIALSLGSFGSSIPNAQEFTGFYPPPYGPSALNPDTDSTTTTNTNTFSSNETELEELSISALKTFHLERLRVFAQDAEVWDALDAVAFETVPLTREVRAMRHAMHELWEEVGEGREKAWWIGSVWPDGVYPERDAGVGDVMRALLEEREGEARLTAVGVNCTQVRYVSGVLRQMEAWLAAHSSEYGGEGERPALVVYPNGGDVYDGKTQTWVTNVDGKGERWAKSVVEAVGDAVRGGSGRGWWWVGVVGLGRRRLRRWWKRLLRLRDEGGRYRYGR
ncbi:Homocysteine S-methyltransferase [Trametopsis cervina]|nr:Homocysteine S-methyltransferase [Trametopsis cervina]